jgi:hypothetical protein
LEQRVKEYLPIIHQEATQQLVESIHWTCPSSGMIKLNVNVAISKFHTILAVVVWDEKKKRAIIKAWAKDKPLCEPLNVKADAILWAFSLADAKNFKSTIVKGDSKIRLDSLLYESTDV